MEGKTSVVILSENRLLRDSIAHILGNKRDFQVSAREPSDSLFSGESNPSFQICVSDSLQCLVDNVIQTESESSVPPRGWVLVAMSDDPRQFLKAVSYGVLGYVLQEASASDVVAAIRGVAQGEAVCPPRLAKVLFDFVSSQKNDLHLSRARKKFRLTRREQQLVPLVGRGLTNKEIAAELSVSEQTIKSHIHRILRKMGVEDRFAISAACETDRIGA